MLRSAYVVYQPIVELPGNDLNILGFEALLRGPKSPMDYFSCAIDSGCVSRLDADIHRLALHSIGYLPEDLKLFLNCHPLSLRDIEIVDKSEYPKVLGDLVLEITEHAGYEDDISMDRILEYKQRNFLIALDDFGTGFNNIDILESVRPDYVKINQNCIKRLDSEFVQEYISLVLECSEKIGARVIAEGVETLKQLHQCQDLGIRTFQGYLFGYPKKLISKELSMA